MAKERKVQATFSDGTVLARGSISRHYTHAWFAKWTYPPEWYEARKDRGFSYTGDENWKRGGFSTSADQCRRNMDGELAWATKEGAVFSLREVVEVVPFKSAAEFRAEHIPEEGV